MRNPIRSWLVLVVLAALGCAADDPMAVFKACAYVSSSAPVRSVVTVSMPDHPFRIGERFSLKVTSSIDGYVYIIQDPGDPDAMVFPSRPDERNRVSRGVAWQLPGLFGFRDRNARSFMVAISPQPVPELRSMGASEIRRFFEQRRFCEGFAWVERAVQYQE